MDLFLIQFGSAFQAKFLKILYNFNLQNRNILCMMQSVKSNNQEKACPKGFRFYFDKIENENTKKEQGKGKSKKKSKSKRKVDGITRV